MRDLFSRALFRLPLLCGGSGYLEGIRGSLPKVLIVCRWLVVLWRSSSLLSLLSRGSPQSAPPSRLVLLSDPTSGKLELSPACGGGRSPATALTQMTSPASSFGSFIFRPSRMEAHPVVVPRELSYKKDQKARNRSYRKRERPKCPNPCFLSNTRYRRANGAMPSLIVQGNEPISIIKNVAPGCQAFKTA